MNSHLYSDILLNTTFCGWGYLHSHMLLNKWITFEDNLSIYLPLQTHDLIYVKGQDFDNLEASHSNSNNHYVGNTNIILYGSATYLILSYRLSIWNYQACINCIPWIYLCNVLGWKTYIESLYIFELFIYLAWSIIQIWLCKKAYLGAHFSYFILKSTSNGVVEIEMVPIYHTSV